MYVHVDICSERISRCNLMFVMRSKYQWFINTLATGNFIASLKLRAAQILITLKLVDTNFSYYQNVMPISQISKRLNLRITRYTNPEFFNSFEISTFLNTRISKFPDFSNIEIIVSNILISKYANIQISKFPNIQISVFRNYKSTRIKDIWSKYVPRE